jgi:hypothetical protein
MRVWMLAACHSQLVKEHELQAPGDPHPGLSNWFLL